MIDGDRRRDVNFHLLLPRIISADPQLQLLLAHREGHAVADIEVDKQRVLAGGIDVVAYRG
ncbi:hypothetical protein D3C75_603450 [compost metagenome]